MSSEQGLIQKINRQVNAMNLRETVDEGTGPMLGGCRQYVLQKQQQLIAAGIDPSRLQPWTVSIPNQGLHGVLVVDGKTVLDNLNPWPTPRSDVTQGNNGYVFIAPWSPAPAAPATAPMAMSGPASSPFDRLVRPTG